MTGGCADRTSRSGLKNYSLSDGCVPTPRYIHPEGLPSDYTISLLFRLLPDTPEEPFALWEILDQNKEPLVGVILDSESKGIFTNQNRDLGRWSLQSTSGFL